MSFDFEKRGVSGKTARLRERDGTWGHLGVQASHGVCRAAAASLAFPSAGMGKEAFGGQKWFLQKRAEKLLPHCVVGKWGQRGVGLLGPSWRGVLT